MNIRENIVDTVADQYSALLARRAKIQHEIALLVGQIAEIALHLEILQSEARGSYTQAASEALGMHPAAAADEARTLRTTAKRPVDKVFYQVNGMLPPAPRKTPKANKPQSPIMKVAGLSEAILAAKERGLNEQELEVIRGMLEKLTKELG